MKRWFHILLLLFSLVTARAADDESAAAFTRFQSGTFDLKTLSEVLPQLADPAKRNLIRSTLAEAENPPHKELVQLLGHPFLAVRLAALELLEEYAGGDLSYNPWTPADSPENTAALVRWSEWANDPLVDPKKDGIFSDEQRQSYLQDILGKNADKATRARRMLEVEGLSAVGFLEKFLQEATTLPAGHRTRIREAQYQITLSKHLGDQAAVTARHLAFGSRDQILSALGSVRAAGLLALPILRDFISHPDPLIRESAIDSLLVTGGEGAVAIIAPLLAEEPDVNVIHGAMRRLKDVPCAASTELVASFLDHPDEDLLISAIQTSLSLASDSSDPFGNRNKNTKATPADNAVIDTLSDPRWRVRATALEYISKRRATDAKDACIALLEDPDDFVRFAAIKAISALGAKDALPKLKALFMADEAMAGPVIQGYGALEEYPDEELLKHLASVSPESRLAALRALKSSQKLLPIALQYTSDENLDIACAALLAITSDSDQISNARVATAILQALQSGSDEKLQAILQNIDLPKSERIDPAIMKALDLGLSEVESTALDSLYNDFLLPGQGAESAGSAPVLPGAQAKLVEEFVLRCAPDRPAEERFRAALVLAKASYPEGFVALFRDLPSFNTGQKTTISEGIYEPSVSEAMPLLEALIKDPVAEVRKEAASLALSNDDAAAFAGLVLKELSRPGTPLQAWEAYSYRFESAVRSSATGKHIFKWALATLQSQDAPTALKVLAIISLRQRASAGAIAALKEATTSPDPLLRRAAWHILFKLRPRELASASETLSTDPEAFVRVVLPLALNAGREKWNHHFSNLQVLDDANWSGSSRKKARLSSDQKALLIKLATEDPSELVRFEASFSLLSHGESIRIDELVALVPVLPKEADARARLTYWLSENAKRATPGLRPLLSVIDPSAIKADAMQDLNLLINPNRGEAFATFAALATVDDSPQETTGPLLRNPEATGEVERESLELVYFHKPGCAECATVRQYIATVRKDFPLLKITEYNLLESSATVLNQALCQRFTVPSADHTLSPAVFCQGGYLIRDKITPPSLAELFVKTMSLEQDDTWMHLDHAEEKAAAEAVDQRYAAFTLPIVIGAGLLDGINPCAFATIIFFLSYLQIARRSPREMLMVGIAFISAVFIAYFCVGLLLHQSLAALNERFTNIQKWMNLGFASLALIAAFLSFRDAMRAKRGAMDDMTLQLPGFLKDRIRKVIRSGARARWFVLTAFVSGLLISLLELACTGQVYAPIIYQIQQGRLDAVVWLTIYNLAFVAPLIVIFALAYGGLRSESLITFQQKHTTAVKIGLGILFLVLAVLILMTQHWQ